MPLLLCRDRAEIAPPCPHLTLIIQPGSYGTPSCCYLYVARCVVTVYAREHDGERRQCRLASHLVVVAPQEASRVARTEGADINRSLLSLKERIKNRRDSRNKSPRFINRSLLSLKGRITSRRDSRNKSPRSTNQIAEIHVTNRRDPRAKSTPSAGVHSGDGRGRQPRAIPRLEAHAGAKLHCLEVAW